MHMHASVRSTSKRSRNYVGDLRGKTAVSYGSCGPGEAKGYLPIISNQNFVVADEIIQSCNFAQPLLPLQYHWQTSHNQVGFPPSCSRVIDGGHAKDMPRLVLLPVKNSIQAAKGAAGRASEFGSTDFPCQMDAKKANPSMHEIRDINHKALINTPSAYFSDKYAMKEAEYCDVPTGRELVPYSEGGLQNNLTSTKNRIYDQNNTLATLESEGPNSCQTPPTIAIPVFNTRKRDATQSIVTQRLRKARITECLESLQELLPHCGKGDKEVVMEDIINYVKYLQLQVKALSQGRLGGEATDDPLIHLEGFGHYILHQQSLNEPLEEIVGQMMEVNMSAMTQLLETRGLYVMPMSLAEGFPENLKTIG